MYIGKARKGEGNKSGKPPFCSSIVIHLPPTWIFTRCTTHRRFFRRLPRKAETIIHPWKKRWGYRHFVFNLSRTHLTLLPAADEAGTSERLTVHNIAAQMNNMNLKFFMDEEFIKMACPLPTRKYAYTRDPSENQTDADMDKFRKPHRSPSHSAESTLKYVRVITLLVRSFDKSWHWHHFA